MNRPAFHTARELGEQLFTLTHCVGDTSLLLEAHRVRGQTMFWIGEISACRTHMEQGIALYEFQQHRSHTLLYGQDPGVVCHSFAAWALWVLGYPEQAWRHIVEALTLAQESAHPFSLAYAQMWGAIVYCFCREASAAQTRAEALMTIAREQGFPVFWALGMTLRGWALAAQGQDAEGIAQMHHGEAKALLEALT